MEVDSTSASLSPHPSLSPSPSPLPQQPTTTPAPPIPPTSSPSDVSSSSAPTASSSSASSIATSSASSSSTSISANLGPPAYTTPVATPILNRPPLADKLPEIDPHTGKVLAVIEKPFVYGTAAFWLGRPAQENAHSHRWTVFVRGLENEDLSYFIASVTFGLHASFAQPNRVITQAPFECTETGWGEFIINITIAFHDTSVPPITLSHLLKLFPPPTIAPSPRKPVMSETYDEFVFHHPSSLSWYNTLLAGPTHKFDDHPYNTYWTTKEFAKEENAQIVKLASALEHVRDRITKERHRLWKVETEIAQLTARIP